jgi:hypothetical protein
LRLALPERSARSNRCLFSAWAELCFFATVGCAILQKLSDLAASPRLCTFLTPPSSKNVQGGE